MKDIILWAAFISSLLIGLIGWLGIAYAGKKADADQLTGAAVMIVISLFSLLIEALLAGIFR